MLEGCPVPLPDPLCKQEYILPAKVGGSKIYHLQLGYTGLGKEKSWNSLHVLGDESRISQKRRLIQFLNINLNAHTINFTYESVIFILRVIVQRTTQFKQNPDRYIFLIMPSALANEMQ